MNIKQKITLTITTFLMLIPGVLGAVPGGANVNISMEGIFNMMKNVLSNISSLFGFNWMNPSDAVGFLKFLLWILIFLIFFVVGQMLFGKIYQQGAGPTKRYAAILAIIFATASVLLTPASLVVSMFSGYATVIMFILIGTVLVGIIWLIYPGLARMGMTGPLLHAVRIIGLLLCWWILAGITQYADSVTGTITFQTIIPLLLLTTKKNKNETRETKW